MAVESEDQTASTDDAAVRNIVAAVDSLGGGAGLTDLAVDLAVRLAALIEEIAAVEGRTALEVADDLFVD